MQVTHFSNSKRPSLSRSACKRPSTAPASARLGIVCAAAWIFLAAAPACAYGIPDTGQTQCDNGANVLASCSGSDTGDLAAYPRQDGRFGRDAQAATGTLGKTGAGAAGFDYTKIGNNGADLAAGAAMGSAPTDWACTRDNVTGLIWEVKNTTHAGLHDSSYTFTWYSSNALVNGGVAGSVNLSNTCNGTLVNCNTEAFVAAVNTAPGLCGQTDWRLPTLIELLTLIHAGSQNPSVDTTYFPNAVAGFFWSSTTYAATSSFAWGVDFATSGTSSRDKTTTQSVRLVSGPH